MLRNICAAVVAATLLAGCSTTYSEMGAMGGVMASPIANDTYRISARGNGYTDATTIQDYSLLKAAETTLAAGKTHFQIMSGNDTTRSSTQQTAGTFNTSFYGNSAFTTYSPGYSYDVVRPGEDLMIRVFTPARGTSLPPNSFVAQEVFNNINPRVTRPKS